MNDSVIGVKDLDSLQDAIKFATIKSKALRNLSQLADKVFKPRLSTFKVSSLIQDVLEWLKLPSLGYDTSEIEVSMEAQLSSVRSDRLIISLVLLNMLESALKDSNRDSKVQVSIRVKKVDQVKKSKIVDQLGQKGAQLKAQDSNKKLEIADYNHSVICTLDYSTCAQV